MNRLLIFWILFFCGSAQAAVIDSIRYRQIIAEGRAELCHLQDINEVAINNNRLADMQFVVEIDGNLGDPYYVVERADGLAQGPQVSTGIVKDTLNAQLGRVYAQYGVEMYMVLIRSLDVIIYSPLPPNATTKDLFIRKLYDEQSNMAVLRSTHEAITQEIVEVSIANRNRDCILFSQAQYCGVFTPGTKSGCWTFTKISAYQAATPTFASITELRSYFFEKIETNWLAAASSFDERLMVTVNEFDDAVKYFFYKSSILTTYNPVLMKAILTLFDEELDYNHLTVAERIHAIAVLAGYPMGNDEFTHNQEGYILRLIQFVKPEEPQIFALLAGLRAVSPLDNNPNYQGEKTGHALIRVLLDKTDDAILLGDDNYTNLVVAITHIITSHEGVLASLLPQSDQDWLDRRIYWDDWHIISTPPVGTHDYDVTLNSNGTVTSNKKVVDQLLEIHTGPEQNLSYQAHWDNAYPPVELDPFAIVAFTNRSKYSMLQVAGAPPGQVFLAPAIFLKYADDKSFNANAIAVGAIALDVIAIATGPGAIIAALEAGSLGLVAFEAIQFLGSSANIVANVSNNPELQEAVEIYNMVVGVWGISRITVSGAKYTADYIAAGRTGVVQKVPLELARSYCEKCDAVGAWNTVDPAVEGQMRRMRKMLGDEVGAAQMLGDNLASRTTWLNNLVSQYGPFSIGNFDPQGLIPANVPTNTYNQMLAQYPPALPTQTSETYLSDLIKSGSTVPISVSVDYAEVIFKIVPEGEQVSAFSPFFISRATFDELETSENIEQLLGLPLQSHSVSYDVYMMSALEPTTIFESTIAPTIENGYNTTGGAKQLLVIDRSKWSNPVKYKLLTPSSQ